MKQKYLTLTQAAENHLQTLLATHADHKLAVRIHLENPELGMEHCAITLCQDSDSTDSDRVFAFKGFNVFINKSALPALKGATLDYGHHNGQDQLTLTAPHLPAGKSEEDQMMEDFMEQYRKGLFKR